MKKVLSLMLSLVLVVVAFATVAYADTTYIFKFAQDKYTVAPGAEFTMDVQISGGYEGDMIGIEYLVPEGFAITAATLADGISGDITSTNGFYTESRNTLAEGATLLTLTVTAPAEIGEYTFEFDPDGTYLCGIDYADALYDFASTTIEVKEAEVEKVFTVAAPVIGDADATCAVVNTTGEAKEIALMVAVYDGNELVNLFVDDVKSVDADANLEVAYEAAAGNTVKAFVLNNLTDCIPYVAAVAK